MLTWIFLALPHTQRQKDIHGDTKRDDVREANLCAKNMAQLIRILTSRRVHWLIEQPASSLFFKYPSMAEVLSDISHTIIKTWMGAFGHEMPKPTMLVGNVSRFFESLHQPKPIGTCSAHGAERKGKWISGTSKLALSAEYTDTFANDCADVFALGTELRQDNRDLCASVWEPFCNQKAPVSRAGGVKDFLDRSARAKKCKKITEFWQATSPAPEGEKSTVPRGEIIVLPPMGPAARLLHSDLSRWRDLAGFPPGTFPLDFEDWCPPGWRTVLEDPADIQEYHNQLRTAHSGVDNSSQASTAVPSMKQPSSCTRGTVKKASLTSWEDRKRVGEDRWRWEKVLEKGSVEKYRRPDSSGDSALRVNMPVANRLARRHGDLETESMCVEVGSEASGDSDEVDDSELAAILRSGVLGN